MRDGRVPFMCPACQNSLSRSCSEDSAAWNWQCVSCSRGYEIRGSVPRFVADAQYSGSFGFQWNRFRKTQLDSHTGLPLSRDRLLQVTGWPMQLGQESVLEAGSGAGRFTEVLAATGAQVHSFDLSEAVDANYANNGGYPNVTIVQASIYAIPFAPGSFDKVLCLGVLQHTPDPDRSFASLASMVRPGGQLVVDVYARSWRALVGWKYLLRPLTHRMKRQTLFGIIERIVPPLVPLSSWLRRVAGPAGARLLPILQYSHWGLPDALNRQWAVLDTFDMYSPAHDHPRSEAEVHRWFENAGFEDISVGPGPNGVIGRGRRPTTAAS